MTEHAHVSLTTFITASLQKLARAIDGTNSDQLATGQGMLA
jgi:hypothetical protein